LCVIVRLFPLQPFESGGFRLDITLNRLLFKPTTTEPSTGCSAILPDPDAQEYGPASYFLGEFFPILPQPFGLAGADHSQSRSTPAAKRTATIQR
jgi:hypothetical protein